MSKGEVLGKQPYLVVQPLSKKMNYYEYMYLWDKKMKFFCIFLFIPPKKRVNVLGTT
jgi:hypothetical protein